jgi:hypothetical protein
MIAVTIKLFFHPCPVANIMTGMPACRRNHCQSVFGKYVVASSKHATSRKTNRKNLVHREGL